MRHVKRGGLALLAAVAVLASSAPAYAKYSPKKAIWGPVTVNGQSQFPLYQTMGVGIYEDDLDWNEIAPTRPSNPTNPGDPAYQWPADLSYAVSQAAQYHMRVLLQVFGTPTWANGGQAPNYPPDQVSDLAAFLTAAARQYPSVHLWMIWGEPDRKANFAIDYPVSFNATRLAPYQARAPRVYAQMLDASYGALKGVSRSNLVIGGNTYTVGDISTRLWIKYMRLPNGRRPRLDMYGHNPFSYRAPNLANRPSPDHTIDFSDVGRLSKLVNQYLAPPHRQLKLFLSEWAIPTCSTDDEFNYYTTPAVQAKWITDAWRIVNKSSWIYALGWIHVYDDPPGGSCSGLLYNNGTPKPGYYTWTNG